MPVGLRAGKEPPASPQAATGTVPAAQTVESIQYVRAIACWAVVIYHLFSSLESEFGWSHPFALGAIGVDLFFVISGYVMAMIVSRGESFSPASFLWRRIARIAPLYWLMTLGLFSIAILLPQLINSTDLGLAKLFFSLAFLPDPVSATSNPALTVGWTLNFEAFFYCVVAVTVGLSGDRTLTVTMATLVLAVLAGLLIDGGVMFDFWTQPIILEFAFGILIWRFGQPIAALPWFRSAWGIGIPLLFSALAITGTYDDTWRVIVWGIPAALFVLGVVPLMTARLPLLARLGDWSYSTYLLHIYVVQFYVKLAANRTGGNPWLFALEITLALVATAVLSGLLHIRFELPMTRTLQRLTNRPVRA